MTAFLISIGLLAGVIIAFYVSVVRAFIARPYLPNDVRSHRREAR